MVQTRSLRSESKQAAPPAAAAAAAPLADSQAGPSAGPSAAPPTVNLNAIFEAEAEFMASRERKQLADGSMMPNRSTKDWYIPAVEGGPPPFRTREEFEAAQDKWEAKIDNESATHVQLAKFLVINSQGEPLLDNKKPVPKDTNTYTRIMNLIDKYQYELEPDEWVLSNIKHIPNYAPSKPNAFAEFMVERKKILKRLGRDDNDEEEPELDSEETISEVEEAAPVQQSTNKAAKKKNNKKKSNKKRQTASDSELESNAKPTKKPVPTSRGPNIDPAAVLLQAMSDALTDLVRSSGSSR